MKGISSLNTGNTLRHEVTNARIVILIVSDTRNDVYSLLEAGADGYFLKDSEPETLLVQFLQAT